MGAQEMEEDRRYRLVLTIKAGDDLGIYAVRRLYPHRNVASVAWELIKEDGTVYHVAVGDFGAHCDCPSFVYKHGRPCKHVKAMHEIGLLPKGCVQ